ncbi:MAG: glycosyltransferase family 4 protein [Candidatus Heimdallarchaeaceae archaeon]
MRIIVVLHKAKKKGGAVVQILRVFDHIKTKEVDVCVFSMDDYNIFKKPVKSFLKASRKLKEIYADFKPDIIFTSDPFFTTFCALKASKSRTPIVLRIGAVYDAFYAGRIMEKFCFMRHCKLLFKLVRFVLRNISKIIIKRVSVIVFNSFFLQKTYRKIAPKSIVIHNGVRVSRIIPLKKSSQLRLVYLGRIEPRKSIEIILKAINILVKKTINFSLSLIGDLTEYPEYWNKLYEYISFNNLQKFIKTQGYVDNEELQKSLQHYDILLFPTDSSNFPITEGLPNVILEGMANGLIVIATNVAGVSEILKTRGGILVEPNPEDFAQAIQKVHNLGNELYTMKLENVEYINNNFNIEKAASRYYKLFKEILEKNS